MYMQMGGWCLTTSGAKVPVYTVDKHGSYYLAKKAENANSHNSICYIG